MNTPDGVKHWEGPGLDAWQPWTPEQVAAELAGVGAPWCVVGGWAIDLWLGERTRDHSDIEIAVPRAYFGAIRDRLSAYKLYVVGDGEVRALAPRERPPAEKHQNWVLDEAKAAWRVDVMLEPGDASTWIYRRDARIHAPRARMIGSRDGIPHLAAHGSLLYKAKNMRDKDEADFAACLPRLDADARTWLADALSLVHPDHVWIERLRSQLRVRRASPDDADTVTRIYVTSWNAGFGSRMPVIAADDARVSRWRAELSRDPPMHWWIAERDGEIVGFVGVGPSRDPRDPTLGEVDTIAVDPWAWRNGVGAALMRTAVQRLRADGYRAGVLWTLSRYPLGESFYRSMGWRLNGATRRDGEEVRYDFDLS